jgi:hypothetical protein
MKKVQKGHVTLKWLVFGRVPIGNHGDIDDLVAGIWADSLVSGQCGSDTAAMSML